MFAQMRVSLFARTKPAPITTYGLQGRGTNFHNIPAVPPLLASFSVLHSAFAKKNTADTRLHSDDNGVTGPDWGHSEVVFKCFPRRCFQPDTSCSVTYLIHNCRPCSVTFLCHVVTFYSSLQRVTDYYNHLDVCCQLQILFEFTYFLF